VITRKPAAILRRWLLLALVTLIAITAVAASSVLVLIVIPERVIEGQSLNAKDRLDAENDIRTTLLSGFGALFVAGGLVFTARSFVTAREGQITDRYSAAVGHLSSRRPSAVIGGIYALERIAHDSGRDVGTINDVLCAVVRQAPYAAPRPSSEVIVALEVLSRLPGSGDIRRLDLRGVTLDGLRLPGIQLAGADLSGASLVLANLEGADLRECQLDNAKFTRSTLTRARFGGAKGLKVEFPGATLDGADLHDVVFPSAVLRAASVRGINASGASLAGADLSNAQFHDVTGSTHVKLDNADLTLAVLDKASLAGADLHSVKGLTKEQAAAAASDKATKWPRDFA
jgi:uncharacterized protein YjbI with pentapeptide repeats